jgi:hypothetical protein
MLHAVQLKPIYKPKTMSYDIEPANMYVKAVVMPAICSSPCPSATMTSTLTCHHIVMFIYIWIFPQKTMKIKKVLWWTMSHFTLIYKHNRLS